MPSSPDWIVGVDDTSRRVRRCSLADMVPELDSRIQRTCQDLRRIRAVPVDAINLGAMGNDGGERCSAFADIPDMEVFVVRTGNNLVVLTIPLYLGGSCCEVCKLEWCSLGTQVMDEDKAVNTASRKKVWMMGGEVDVGDGAVMGS